MKKTGSDVLKEFITTFEINYIFGNPGTTELKFLEAIEQCDNATYFLTLQESSTVGIAAGYAMITRKPALINLHNYVGLANSVCNMYNAFTSGIPLLIIAGQHSRPYLIHSPVMSGDLTSLAHTAVKYAYEVNSASDLAVALQRGYAQAILPGPGPVFLSIPMDIWQEETQETTIKKTRFLHACINAEIEQICEVLTNTPKGKLAFIADYEVGASNSIRLLHTIADQLNADIYAAPYHVREVINPLSVNYKGRLSDKSGEVHNLLLQYETVVLLGEKVKGYLYTGQSSIPQGIRFIQISAASEHLAFDYPCDLAILGNLEATLTAISKHLKINGLNVPLKPATNIKNLEKKYKQHPLHSLIVTLLNQVNRSVHLITEGSSEDAIVQDIATTLGFLNVNFSPRGGGLGWAMPLAIGISLATRHHSICFVGDGGSMYAIHSIWSAAKYKIPVIFICFVNREYRVLKTDMSQNRSFTEEDFFRLDLNHPPIDVQQIALSFGAQVKTIKSKEEVETVLKSSFAFQGPTFITLYHQ
ncbi:TPA: thiamine pyrophosphate-binding protein [Legionella pneumophila]|uniref:Thiamine pyrophosphate-binding protein n=1 Tax=Legionella pneumophila TaxID=446 RepID=A0AAN5Q384_LEGPN|nr:thiamine pyrophosphate-binding protein [Legionella pneumophila]TIH00832.1 thiamine pyrophosphate-binding protein [Legionella pneumophila]HAT3858456.1 thiamine pyrophosphate-binding protein [Legionella pneumophila]HAT3868338.1 thiamine pyrophosphate-binding protein [Legionella pneumophila]HAT3877642.1 thiamine pyrophosphate-binding protein [Legionella pneumophila]HAT3973569.1 thiamine pyrophosphate-binding protein [Legionella pneumophila]